jgi:hypothetical protein
MVVYLWLPALFVVALAFSPLISRWFAIDKSWPSFPGRIVDARATTVGAVGSQYRGRVVYRLDLRVRWAENGSTQDAWMPTRVTSEDQDYLRLLASQLTVCTVRRNPHNPGFVVADLADDWQPLHPTSSEKVK